jgi:hypothetical protein
MLRPTGPPSGDSELHHKVQIMLVNVLALDARCGVVVGCSASQGPATVMPACNI